MMIRRHFEGNNNKNVMTTLADLNKNGREFVSDIFPPVEEEEKPKRKRKTADK